jgi:phytanoyl-CoA hydroxylase
VLVSDQNSLGAQFERDGFVVIPNFKTAEQVAKVRKRAGKIVEAFDPSVSRTIFNPRDNETPRSDYYMTSMTSVCCFFEEEAFDENGELRQAKEVSINRLGYAMHEVDPVFEEFSHGPDLDALARDLGSPEPHVYQSVYIFKQPHIGGEVTWHQDASFFLTDPPSCMTLWFALERADQSNGCLWVQRGGHRRPLRQLFSIKGSTPELVDVDSTPWPSSDEAEPLEVDAGTVIAFHGLLPHYSAPNRTERSRHAYTLQFVDGRVPYSKDNWIQRSDAFPVRGFV